MARYVYFDLNSGAILNWIDDEAYSYPELPPLDQRCYVTDPQWDARGSMYGWIVQGGQLIPPPALTLAQIKEEQMQLISSSCGLAIYEGFDSVALGSSYHYPAKLLDQQNLSASVLSSLIPGLPADWVTPFWCQDPSGNWSYVPHTASQIQQVGQDGKADVLAKLAKCQGYYAQIAAATTEAQVKAIVWQ